MIEIIKPQNYPINLQNAIFLAGPCPRTEDAIDWRDEFIQGLEETDFRYQVINPTNREWEKMDEPKLKNQTKWEHDMMKMSSCVVFVINRTKENPAFTTNIEFGMWCNNNTDLIVCIPNGSEKCEYIETVCKEKNIPLCHTYDECYKLINDRFNRKESLFFTADTHFGSQRTLELSKRQFDSVHNMDMQMVSNWNKKITCNDIVYHLGLASAE